MQNSDYIGCAPAPDLRPYFRFLNWRVMPHSCGHLVASDFSDRPADDPVFGLYKRCGSFSRDEISILYGFAKQAPAGIYLSIGAHCGWDSAHLSYACGDRSQVVALEPMLRNRDFLARFHENTDGWDIRSSFFRSDEARKAVAEGRPLESLELPTRLDKNAFSCVVVDGDHDADWPVHDVEFAHENASPGGLIVLLHDAWGEPVLKAARRLLELGYEGRFYQTPHGVFVAWKGVAVEPVVHTPDPYVDWEGKQRLSKIRIVDGKLA